jgi:anti-anti-sigma factor
MPLALNTRAVGDVTVIKCAGRIVAGEEMECLRSEICGWMREQSLFVLHLADVVLIDSSGLGMMVRLLTSARKISGDIKLCSVAPPIQRLLTMTNLHKLFEIHDCEDNAISAFYSRRQPSRGSSPCGPPVLCADESCDVLAYLRAFFRSGGYDVQTTTNVRDALLLLRVTRPILLLLGPNLKASAAIQQAFAAARANAPVIELGADFSTQDAGQAASLLLQKVQARLQRADATS